MRLGLALPHTDEYVPKQFFDSFTAMTKPAFTYLRPMTHGPLDTIRNELVGQAIQTGCTKILMLDTDQVYERDTIPKMLAHDLPIVVAKVHRRYPPYDPILMRGTIDNFKKVPEDEWICGGLVKVDSTGFGAVLIDMEVFTKIPQPWFKWDVHRETGEPVGEDVYFWSKVRKAGYDIHVDCDIKIGHLKTLVINEDSYLAYHMRGK